MKKSFFRGFLVLGTVMALASCSSGDASSGADPTKSGGAAPGQSQEPTVTSQIDANAPIYQGMTIAQNTLEPQNPSKRGKDHRRGLIAKGNTGNNGNHYGWGDREHDDEIDTPSLSASRSIAIKPLLCLVFAYSFPGFPRPAISFIRFLRSLLSLLSQLQ